MASELPCAGTRVGMRQLKAADRDRLARKVRAHIHYVDWRYGVMDSARHVIGYDLTQETRLGSNCV
jgi:hypothetical protein